MRAFARHGPPTRRRSCSADAAREPRGSAGEGGRRCDAPPFLCQPGEERGGCPRAGALPLPACGPSLQRLASGRLGEAILHLVFPMPGGLAASGPGVRAGVQPPAHVPRFWTSSGTNSVGGTMERAVPRANLWSWPRERQEQAPPAGLWAARSPRAGEPRGRGQGGRSGEGKVGMPKWGGGRLAPFNRLQAPGRRHAPGPAAFLGPRPGRCLDGNQRPAGHAS